MPRSTKVRFRSSPQRRQATVWDMSVAFREEVRQRPGELLVGLADELAVDQVLVEQLLDPAQAHELGRREVVVRQAVPLVGGVHLLDALADRPLEFEARE